jgi:hypothetical protein
MKDVLLAFSWQCAPMPLAKLHKISDALSFSPAQPLSRTVPDSRLNQAANVAQESENAALAINERLSGTEGGNRDVAAKLSVSLRANSERASNVTNERNLHSERQCEESI